MENRYIEQVSNNKWLQAYWKPEIGDLVFPIASKVPTSAVWIERANTAIRVHALNESDLIFLDEAVKLAFVWVPRATDIINIIIEKSEETLTGILQKLADMHSEASLEERVYILFSNLGIQ